MKKCFNYLTIYSCVALLSGCSSLSDWGLTDKSNLAPPAALVNFQPSLTIQPIWSETAISRGQSQTNPLALSLNQNTLYVADSAGNVAAYDQKSGQLKWRQPLGNWVNSGPTTNDGFVAVSTKDGNLALLNATNGQLLWKNKLTGIAYANPAVNKHFTIAKTTDGRVSVFDTQNGNLLWQYDHQEPSFTANGDSSPILLGNTAIVGFSDGRLIAMNLASKQLLWELPISMPSSLQESAQMVGVIADPVIVGGSVYTVTYQGNLASVELNTGKPLWSKSLSAYQDFTWAGNLLFITDANSNVYGINRHSGNILWQQTQLNYRGLTAPVYMAARNAIVVGDAEGYLHILSAADGHFLARIQVSKSPILTTPAVTGNQIYVLNKTGILTAYSLH